VSSSAPARTASSAKLSVIVPQANAITPASGRRRPKYISPSSAQLQVAVNQGTPVSYGLTPSSPGCSVISGSLSCTFSIAAASGNDSFSLSLLDAAGAVLSRNVVNATLAAGVSTPINVTLAGVPASVVAAPGPGAGIEGSANPAFHVPGLFPQPIELEALDADGNVIIGPGAPTIAAPAVSTGTAYASVASAQSTDPNAYVLTPVAGAGGQTITITASAQSIPLSDGTTSSPVSSSTNFTFTPAIAVASGLWVNTYSVETGNQIGQMFVCSGTCGLALANAIVADGNGNLYVSYVQFTGFSPTHSVAKFPAGATKPSVVLGSSNGVTGSVALALDKTGMLYVANAGSGFGFHHTQPSVTEYAPGATSPTYKITGLSLTGPQGIAVTPSGQVYVTNSDGTIPVYGSGNQTTSLQTLTDPSLSNPDAILVDAAGGIYTIDATNNDIAYFAPGATSVTNTLTYADFANSPFAMMFDPSGNLWVAVNNVNATHEFSATALPSNLSLTNSLNAAGRLAWIP
jgi:hypothetical protein